MLDLLGKHVVVKERKSLKGFAGRKQKCEVEIDVGLHFKVTLARVFLRIVR